MTRLNNARKSGQCLHLALLSLHLHPVSQPLASHIFWLKGTPHINCRLASLASMPRCCRSAALATSIRSLSYECDFHCCHVSMHLIRRKRLLLHIHCIRMPGLVASFAGKTESSTLMLVDIIKRKPPIEQSVALKTRLCAHAGGPPTGCRCHWTGPSPSPPASLRVWSPSPHLVQLTITCLIKGLCLPCMLTLRI